MNNFKFAVPENVQNKLHSIAEHIKDNFSDMISTTHELESDVRLDDIEGNYKSGWIPEQDGGFSVNALCGNDIDSSYHLTEKQTEFNHQQDVDCFNSFLSDNDLESGLEYDNLTEAQKDDLSEYEMERWEPALLSFEMFIDGYQTYSTFYGKQDLPSVTFRVSINYKDAPYYREKYAEDIKTLVLEIDEFLAMSEADIIEKLKI